MVREKYVQLAVGAQKCEGRDPVHAVTNKQRSQSKSREHAPSSCSRSWRAGESAGLLEAGPTRAGATSRSARQAASGGASGDRSHAISSRLPGFIAPSTWSAEMTGSRGSRCAAIHAAACLGPPSGAAGETVDCSPRMTYLPVTFLSVSSHDRVCKALHCFSQFTFEPWSTGRLPLTWRQPARRSDTHSTCCRPCALNEGLGLSTLGGHAASGL